MHGIVTRGIRVWACLALVLLVGGCMTQPGPVPSKPATSELTTPTVGPYSVGTTVTVGDMELSVRDWRARDPEDPSGRFRTEVDLAAPGYRWVEVNLVVRDPAIPLHPRRGSTSESLYVVKEFTLIVDGEAFAGGAGGLSYAVAQPDQLLHTPVFEVPEDFQHAKLQVSVPSETSATVVFDLR